MNTERAQVGRRFWLWWVLASTVGLTVGLWVGLLVALILAWGEPERLVVAGAVGGAASGALIGGAQLLVLRRQVPRAGWWVLASAVGFAVGGGVAVAVHEVVKPAGVNAAVGAAGGVLLAASVIAQWMVLRVEVSRAGWWVLASIVGAAVGTAIGMGVAAGGVVVGIKFVGDVSGFLVGVAIYGAITGGVLVWLLRQPAEKEIGPRPGRRITTR